MGMVLPSAAKWAGFKVVTTGDGSVTFNDEVATIKSAVNAGTALLMKEIPTLFGEEYTFSFLARRISGFDSTSGSGYIDWPVKGGFQTRVEIDSSEWQEYSVRYCIPISNKPDSAIQLCVGIYTPLGGEIEVAYPRITVSNSSRGAMRSMMHGLFHWYGPTSALTFRENFPEFGYDSARYDAPSKTLFIKVRDGTTLGAVFRNSSPLIFIQMTPDGNPEVIKLMPKAGNYSNGEFAVKFLDVTTGDYADIAALSIYFQIMLQF